MPDEQKDDQVEAEMMRLMSQESGGDTPQTTPDDAPLTATDDVEAAMLQMLQSSEQEGGEGAAAGPSEQDLNSILEQEMRSALQDSRSSAPAPPSASAPAPAAFHHGLDIPSDNVQRLLDVRLVVSIELGKVQVPIKEIIGWTEGSLIELDKIAGEPVDVLVNAKTFARGEVVVVAENFGVRITQMTGAESQT
jgi:flagellar motor switch protein FliN/FliY